MNEDILVPLIVMGSLFVVLPWIMLHYVTKWKQAPKITREDEGLLDELHHLARRLEDRIQTVERIIAADNPDFRTGLTGAAPDWKPGIPAQSSYSIDRRN